METLIVKFKRTNRTNNTIRTFRTFIISNRIPITSALKA